jgi:hypothetical protein
LLFLKRYLLIYEQEVCTFGGESWLPIHEIVQLVVLRSLWPRASI